MTSSVSKPLGGISQESWMILFQISRNIFESQIKCSIFWGEKQYAALALHSSLIKIMFIQYFIQIVPLKNY